MVDWRCRHALLLCAVLWLAEGAPRNRDRQNQRQQAGYRLVNNTVPRVMCEARDLKMMVTRKGCEEKTIQNKMCAGQCLSYFSPHVKHADGQIENDQLSFCEFCKPSNSSMMQVPLNCTLSDGTNTVAIEEVEIIHECACLHCFPDAPANTATTDEEPNTENIDLYWEREQPEDRFMEEVLQHDDDGSRVIARDFHPPATQRQSRRQRQRGGS